MEAYSQPEGDILVRTLYNGVALKYPQCENDFNDGEYCTLDHFEEAMQDRLFIGDDSDLKAMCDATPTDPIHTQQLNEKFLFYQF